MQKGANCMQTSIGEPRNVSCKVLCLLYHDWFRHPTSESLLSSLSCHTSCSHHSAYECLRSLVQKHMETWGRRVSS